MSSLSSNHLIRVWRVSGPLSGDADQMLFDSYEDAGIFAAEAAESAWDAAEGEPTKPGPAITIQCYEMTLKEFEELTTDV